MFNVITDTLPEESDGVVFNTDFKQGLKYFKTLANKDFSEQIKAKLIIKALIKELPEIYIKDPEEIFKKISWFMLCGIEGEKESADQKLFDFNVDSGLLYSAFFQVYGVDLRKEDFHWWQFMELFRGLPDGTKLSHVIEIRGRKTRKGASAEERLQLTKLKNAYAIDKGVNLADKNLANFFDKM